MQAVLDGRLYTDMGRIGCACWQLSPKLPAKWFLFSQKMTFHSCILILYGSCSWFTHYTLLPSGDAYLWVWAVLSNKIFPKLNIFFSNCLRQRMHYLSIFFLYFWREKKINYIYARKAFLCEVHTKTPSLFLLWQINISCSNNDILPQLQY